MGRGIIYLGRNPMWYIWIPNTILHVINPLFFFVWGCVVMISYWEDMRREHSSHHVHSNIGFFFFSTYSQLCKIICWSDDHSIDTMGTQIKTTPDLKELCGGWERHLVGPLLLFLSSSLHPAHPPRLIPPLTQPHIS